MRDREIVIAIGSVAAVVVLIGILGGGMMGWGMMGPGMMGWGGYSYSPWWGVLMLLFSALVIGGIVLIILWLVRRTPSGTAGADADRALQILRERYARGEITQEQYDQMRRALE